MGRGQMRLALNRPDQRNSLLQGIWLGNFCGWRIAEAIPAGLVPPRQRVAANSLCLKGSEFVPRGSETFRGWQGIRKARQGIGDSSQGARASRPPAKRTGGTPALHRKAANVSYRSFIARSFVDGANFDGKIDNAGAAAPAVLRAVPAVFCAGLHPAPPSESALGGRRPRTANSTRVRVEGLQ